MNPVKEGKEGGRGWFDTHPATSDRIERLRRLRAWSPLEEAAGISEDLD